MALLVLAYPRLSGSGFDWIQSIRARHDERYYQVVKPHFTIVFPVMQMEESTLVEHVLRHSTGVSSISFVCRCALVVEDHSKEFSHVFLVPDEGLSDMVKLHDRLYGDALTPELRLDIPYLPHIGIGNHASAMACKRQADELNARGFQLEGRIDSLDVVRYEQGEVLTLRQLALEHIPAR